jgi:hypothetical protein
MDGRGDEHDMFSHLRVYAGDCIEVVGLNRLRGAKGTVTCCLCDDESFELPDVNGDDWEAAYDYAHHTYKVVLEGDRIGQTVKVDRLNLRMRGQLYTLEFFECSEITCHWQADPGRQTE